jgi:hypothetical protein
MLIPADFSLMPALLLRRYFHARFLPCLRDRYGYSGHPNKKVKENPYVMQLYVLGEMFIPIRGKDEKFYRAAQQTLLLLTTINAHQRSVWR